MDTFRAKTRPLPTVELSRGHFTIEQAGRALVLVRRIVADILKDYQRVLDLQEIQEIHQSQDKTEVARQVQADIIRLVERLQSCADELLELGAEIKDWSAGIVDFPAQRDGREVHLCWRFGEPHISFWHLADEGCGSRRVIESPPAS